MSAAVVVKGVGKTYRRYHADRPSTIQEAVAKRAWRMRAVERTWALRDVTFTVDTGKTVGIIGSNGSGKSTLLRLIGGVGRPDEGWLEVHGRLGALLDLGAGFHPDLTGRENAILSGVLNGLTRQEVIERLDAIIAFAEIEKAVDNPVRTYSSGMQMRLAFSTAIHTEPEVLLIDEVLAVGDVAFQHKCLERISRFRSTGCSILIVSHDATTIRELCDEAVWMDKGRLVAHGGAREVAADYEAYMRTEEAPSREAERRKNRVYPQATACIPQNGEPSHGADRFGTLELEITGVRVLDGRGQPAEDVSSGDALTVELEYRAQRPLPAPIFHVRLSRDDGLVCFDHSVRGPDLGILEVLGDGRVRLVLDRLDLNTGDYVVDVGCYARAWSHTYDCRLSAHTFSVRGTGVRGAILNTPHRWEAIGTPAAVVAD